MKYPAHLLCLKYSDVNPTNDEARDQLESILLHYSDLHPCLDNLKKFMLKHRSAEFELIGTNSYQGPRFIPVRYFETLRSRFQLSGLSFVFSDIDTQGQLFWTLLNFPKERPSPLIIAGFGSAFTVDLRKIRSSNPTTSRFINSDDDIRQMLAGFSHQRRGIISAGSPGWESKRVLFGQKSQTIRSKNEGLLQATLNDTNSMFHLMHSLTSDDTLAGIVTGFLIRKKKSLINFLSLAASKPSAEKVKSLLDDPDWENGFISVDARISWPIGFQGGKVVIAPGSRILGSGGENELINGERLMYSQMPKIYDTENVPFIFIYYSGHGSSKGEIQIEEKDAVSAEELFEKSYKDRIPYLIVLDMCYSWKFGHAYKSLLERYNWNGIIMCANDESHSQSLSFESEQLCWVRRIHWPLNIVRSDWPKGRGVYTTAFVLGMLYLRYLDVMEGKYISVSISDFNDFVLRSICKHLSEESKLPFQNPVVYSHTPK